MAPNSQRQTRKSNVADQTQPSQRDSDKGLMKTKEKSRLDETYDGQVDPWRSWGPYVSERSWVVSEKITASRAPLGSS